MRRAAKTDATHAAIRDHLRSVGWSVFDASSLGKNFPDLVCSRLGFTALVECKSGEEHIAYRSLSEGQREFINSWQGSVVVGTTPEQVERELSARLLGFRLDQLRSEEAELDDYAP